MSCYRPLIEPLLMDFGLSRNYVATSLSKTTLKFGTLRWSAPELINETVERASEQTDIWALGMTILVRWCYYNISDLLN